ncbi:MAG: leucine--tRNA ligase, partial [Aeromicrobium sp.]|nr:leucine--tRNA ligase [Aeromicrobium sp.]
AEVTERDGRFYLGDVEVNQEFGKIGKSLKNVVTPDDFIGEFGADTFRLFEMFSGPLEQSRPWDAKAIVGPYRLLQRIWRVVVDEQSGEPHVSDGPIPDELNRLLHKTIAATREGYQTLRFNTSIARLTELNNAITAQYPHGSAPRALAEALVLMIAPLAPHIAEELWSRLGHPDSLTHEAFPEADPAYLVEDSVTCVVQVLGKVRGKLEVSPDISDEDLTALALAEPNVVRSIDGREVRKVIVRAPKLVSIVV